MKDTILLDPDLFMALGLSAEANGGMGANLAFDKDVPRCVRGHCAWLDGVDAIFGPIPTGDAERALWAAYPVQHSPGARWANRNDDCFSEAGEFDRVPFARWCEIVGVDVAE